MGSIVGAAVGLAVGTGVGSAVGDAVGLGVGTSTQPVAPSAPTVQWFAAQLWQYAYAVTSWNLPDGQW